MIGFYQVKNDGQFFRCNCSLKRRYREVVGVRMDQGVFSYSLCDFFCPTHSRFAGKYRDTIGSRKEFNGELNCSESECDSTSRRLSFMKMVGLGKLKRESMADHSSQGPEEESVQEEVVEEVKPREPLSGRKTRRMTLFLSGNPSSAQLQAVSVWDPRLTPSC